MRVAKEQIQQIIADNSLNSVADIYTLLRDSFKDILAVIYGRFQKMPNFPAIIFPHTTYYGKKGNFGNVFRKFLN